MEFKINEKLKKKMKKEGRKQKKGIYYLWIVEKVILYLSIASTILFPIYCRMTGTFVGINTRTGEKDYWGVSVLTAIMFGMILTAWLFIMVLSMRLEGVYIGGRVDEAIEFNDNLMFYNFRIQYESLSNQRNLVIIDLNSIKNISFDEKTRKIEIEGKMLEKMVQIDNPSFMNNAKFDLGENVSKVEIYDYFSPSLYDIIKNNIPTNK